MSSHISLEELQLGLEALRYEQFFRQRGIYKQTMFPMPRVNDASTFELPKFSLMHYLPESDVELGPAPTHLFLRKATAHILADHVTELTVTKGNPMKVPIAVTQLTDGYKRQYRRIRPLRDIKTAARDERTVIIENYALLSRLYRYRVTFQTRLFKFENVIGTFIDRANYAAENAPMHNQFLEVRLPKRVPTKQEFVMGGKGLDKTRMRSFPDDGSLMLLELWKWLGPLRKNSQLSRLSPDALNKMNFVFIEKGKYVVLSLRELDSWRKNPDVENDKGFDPVQMQLYYLKFLDSIFAIRTVAAGDVVVTTTPDADGATDDDDTLVQLVEDGEAVKELNKLIEEAESADVGEDEVDVQEAFIPVEEVNDFIEPRSDDPSDSDIDPELMSGPIERMNALAEDGLISAAEERRFERLSENYKAIKNPYGEGTLADFMTITEEDLSLEEEVIKDLPTVLDKSMLKSHLPTFLKKYIGNKVLQKDIVNAVMSFQKVGVLVTDYRVETVVDVKNEYEIHSVELQPIGGAKSTWKFKVPKVSRDGVVKSAGVRYRLRTQRGDMPIRKTKSHEVALSSYYGKMFIRRSLKKVDDYGAWLSNQILLTAADSKDIQQIKYGNAFNREIKAPRAFSAVSSRFKRFTVKGKLQLNFDYKELVVIAGEKVVQAALANGEMICGKIGDDLLSMASSGYIYNLKTGDVYGTLEELCGLPSDKAPIDSITANMMGKDIPIAMLLGQQVGISRLLRLLKSQHRFVSRGGRLNLEKGEYVIRFKDQSLILNRDDKTSSLIFGGLTGYHKALESFEYESFDRKDVYGAVYMKMGLSTHYTVECDNMFKLFIDPITKGILKGMGEPTKFGPLLLRAVSLLSTDDYPRVTDGELFRMKGYERISGRVYKSVVTAARNYAKRPVTAKTKVDINPFEVWNAIMEDPAMSVVDDINPMHNLKEYGNVTYAGTDGRSSRTMVRSHREMDEKDPGTISEATVDNGDVAVTVFMSSNPQLGSLRGEMKPFDRSKENLIKESSSLLSPIALAAPCVTHDDQHYCIVVNNTHHIAT